MSKKQPSTAHEMFLSWAEVYYAERHAAGASPQQVRQEILAAWFQLFDREFTASWQATHGNGWPAPMDPRALHGVAGEFVRAIEQQTEADPSALLGHFLVEFGCAAGRNAYVRVEEDRHYANLYMLMVGDTARGRKGTSARRVQAVFLLADRDWAESQIAHGGLSSGEGLASAVRDQNKDSGDPGVMDKRYLVIEGEFSAVQKVLEREGNTLSPILRSLWDIGESRFQTKHSPLRATGVHFSFIAHTTLTEYLARLDASELAGGSANRILHLAVKRSRLLPRGGQLQADVAHRIAARVAAALDFARGQSEVTFSAHALTLWDRAYPFLTADRPGQYGQATARAEAQVLRLALVYALLDQSAQIQEVHLWAALAFWDYCDRSAVHVYGDRQSDRTQDSVLALIQGHDGWISRDDIVNAKNRHLAGARLQEAIESLLRAGLIAERKEQTGGRPKHLYCATKARKPTLLELISLSSQLSEETRDTTPPATCPDVEREAIQSEPPAEPHDDESDGREL
jgi:predicted transcriptional regulator